MNTPRPTVAEPLLKEPVDFSLVLGGPLYQLWRRTRLSGDALQLLHRRVVVMVLLAWLPLLALSAAEGHAWGGSLTLAFLDDIEIHVRLLLALPLLIVAEMVVHQRMRPVVGQFLARWIDHGRGTGEVRLGHRQGNASLADLSNSFEVVAGMRWAPFSLQTVLQLAIVTLLPVGPLLLTIFPLEDLLDRLLKIVF